MDAEERPPTTSSFSNPLTPPNSADNTRGIFRDESNLFQRPSKANSTQQLCRSINGYLGQIVHLKTNQSANQAPPLSKDDPLDIYLKSIKSNLILISEHPQILREVKISIQQTLLEALNDVAQIE